jgi:nucleotide-binding universal stress UspA family protein
VTEKVLRKASCPVLTVPPGSDAAPETPAPFQKILCPVDFSPLSIAALGVALSLAEESGKKLILTHIFDWPADRAVPPAVQADLRHSQETALRELHALIPVDARPWCDSLELTAIGRPYEEILRLADANNADLIVMGVHGRNSVNAALFGSTVNQVVRHAACPVLTIRRS